MIALPIRTVKGQKQVFEVLIVPTTTRWRTTTATPPLFRLLWSHAEHDVPGADQFLAVLAHRFELADDGKPLRLIAHAAQDPIAIILRHTGDEKLSG